VAPEKPSGPLTVVAGLPPAVLLGAAAVMFLIAAGVVVMLVLGGRGEPTAPAPVAVATPEVAAPTPAAGEPAVPSIGRLLVESQPPGAEVSVNGDYRGITPLDLAGLPLGEYEVRMELKGFEPRTQTVSLTSDAPEYPVKASLTRLGPALGSAEILSDPVGATVSIDGREVGVTPLPAYRLRPGSYRVDIAKDGYETWSGSVVVGSGGKGSVNAQLRAVSAPAATPVPSPPASEAPDPNRVFQENELDGTVRKVSGPPATYPRNAPPLRSGESRSVSVSFVVLESGEPSDVKIIESGGNGIVDDAVVSMIQESRFAPPTKGGVKVKVLLLRKFTFRAG
jgi:TonB family protein